MSLVQAFSGVQVNGIVIIPFVPASCALVTVQLQGKGIFCLSQYLAAYDNILIAIVMFQVFFEFTNQLVRNFLYFRVDFFSCAFQCPAGFCIAALAVRLDGGHFDIGHVPVGDVFIIAERQGLCQMPEHRYLLHGVCCGCGCVGQYDKQPEHGCSCGCISGKSSPALLPAQLCACFLYFCAECRGLLV